MMIMMKAKWQQTVYTVFSQIEAALKYKPPSNTSRSLDKEKIVNRPQPHVEDKSPAMIAGDFTNRAGTILDVSRLLQGTR